VRVKEEGAINQSIIDELVKSQKYPLSLEGRGSG
jgi:hypothetical protein